MNLSADNFKTYLCEDDFAKIQVLPNTVQTSQTSEPVVTVDNLNTVPCDYVYKGTVPDRLYQNTAFGYMEYFPSVFPKIKDVILNNPATIIYWDDGTKTVVKCMDEDTYAPDVGIAMCFMKKLFENDDVTYTKKDKTGSLKAETAYGYKKIFKKWIDGYGKD